MRVRDSVPLTRMLSISRLVALNQVEAYLLFDKTFKEAYTNRWVKQPYLASQVTRKFAHLLYLRI